MLRARLEPTDPTTTTQQPTQANAPRPNQPKPNSNPKQNPTPTVATHNAEKPPSIPPYSNFPPPNKPPTTFPLPSAPLNFRASRRLSASATAARRSVSRAR